MFHQSSKDLRGGGMVNIPATEAEWPDEWKTVYYKSYPRFKKIQLPRTRLTADFFELVRMRHTNRQFSRGVLTPEKLSTLLRYTCGIVHDNAKWNPRRAHPSGGARFPIEAYPILLSDAGNIPAGVYHYNVKDHALDTLDERPFSSDDIMQLVTYPFVQNASMLLILTTVFWRTQMKYGERGYRYIMLEAGHIGQNVYLASTALNLKCSGLGGTHDEKIESLLGVDGIGESLVYALVVG